MSTGADSTPLRPPSATGLEATAAMAANAATLEREMAWFDTVLQARLTHHFQHPDTTVALVWPAAPDLAGDASEYAAVVIRNGLGSAERLVLVLALLPHMRPQALDTLFVRNATLDRGFSEFGGWKGKTHGGFLPTAETAAFVLVGTELRDRFALMALFDESHAFHRQGMLRIEHRDEGEPWFSGALVLSPEYLMRLTGGGEHKPDFSPSFPARRITTPLR